jgi:hypothetical protein
MELREKVLEALNNSVANGYRDVMMAMSPLQLAVDMTTYSADLEDEDCDRVAEIAAEWQEGQKQ